MLPELIARLRGVDKWPTVQATVTQSELVSTPRSGDWNNISFFYRPAGSEIQSGTLAGDSLTSVYSLQKNDTFEIQYDPNDPSHFYCKDVQSRIRTFGTVMAPVVVLFVIVLVVSTILDALKHSR
jgi:Protein of unknown function (DUF3592)